MSEATRGLGYGHVKGSVLLVFPLFLIYEIGLIFTPATNGVDFVSRSIFRFLDYDKEQYILAHLSVAAVFLLVLFILWRRGSLAMERITPMILESSIYALTLGSFIIVVMDRLVGLELLAIQSSQLGNALIVSLGAGVHEEMIFRLGLMGFGSVIVRSLFSSDRRAVLFAAIVSSFLFALAHHYGMTGEPFDWSIFIYRCIAGMTFAAIFYYRSLAHAVYSHFLYDFYVMVIS